MRRVFEFRLLTRVNWLVPAWSVHGRFLLDCNGDSDAAVVTATAAVVLAIQEETEDKDRAARSSIAEFRPLCTADAATTTAALHCDMQLQTNNAAALMSRLMPHVGDMKAWRQRLFPK